MCDTKKLAKIPHRRHASSATCPAYIINYDRSACYRLDLTSEGRTQLLVPVTGHFAYFEKICLQAPACGKAWVFERWPGRELAGLDDLVLRGITSRRQCEDYCLLNHQLPCRSAEYVAGSGLCPTDEASCDWDEQLDREMAYSDLQLVTSSADACRRACETAAVFNCRSFTFTPSRSLCRLSAEDTLSAGPLALAQNAAAIFYQRGPCLDLELVCAVDRMTVRLRTEEPFTGRIFALDAPTSCEVRGTGQRTTEATFYYADGRCGVVRETAQSYTALVVIQLHALIQRRGDRATKLLCTYDTAEKTISTGLDLLVDRIDAAVVTATVNATAATPRVSLHVRDTSGADVSGTALGEPLFLSLELDHTSIFGMFARNLVARGGSSGESIVLLDERGCPTETSVFGGFTAESEDRTTITAPFEAFKFSEDPVVRFQVTVQFCLDSCRPAQCGSERRHRRAAPRLDPVTHQRTVREEAPLQREIFVDGGRACLALICVACVYQRRQQRLRSELPSSSTLYSSQGRLSSVAGRAELPET
ncbi:uncharacterized protein LOC119090015 [Pollicipes pollicipes]|uniref:uncharacterized protein LOC119090015 n=1 Tax=Pollicipes pollicipes TaxID=41117 RepID=UPI0018858541|nr:uncharacterized protein LOC119090015 [Pollicipes pollicipes]